MTHIDEPRPRDVALLWKPIDWPIRRTFAMRPSLVPPSALFSAVVEGRRSQRHAARPSIGQALEVLQLSSKLHDGWNYQGIDRHHAPSVSAGGLHGIDLVLEAPVGRARLFRYDRQSNSLNALNLADAMQLTELRCLIRQCLPSAQPIIVCLIADQSKYDAAYESSESLIWRDSGALLQIIAMAAYALGFAACVLGPHGKQMVRALDLDSHRMMACGLIAIGKYS